VKAGAAWSLSDVHLEMSVLDSFQAVLSAMEEVNDTTDESIQFITKMEKLKDDCKKNLGCVGNTGFNMKKSDIEIEAVL